MVNLILLFTFLAVVCTTYGWHQASPTCDCFNIIYNDKPKSIAECSPKSKFLKQILQNYNNLYFSSLLNGSPYGCDFARYREKVHNMKERTLQIVEAYFSCAEANCTSAILAAEIKFADYRDFEFNPYSRCSFTNFNEDCAQVQTYVRPPVYASAENTMVTLLTCAKLKAEAFSGYTGVQHPTSPVILHQDKGHECNCVKTDPRPIPKDECECFSPKFISEVRDFIGNNFGRINTEYNINHNSTCESSELLGYNKQLKEVALAMTKLLEKPTPTFGEFDEYFKQYLDLQLEYRTAARNYILTNDKSCYYIVRKVRQNPLVIVEAVVSVLTKCIGYKNLDKDRCSIFLK